MTPGMTGESGLLGRVPLREDYEYVGEPDDGVSVEILRTIAAPPFGEQDQQIAEVDPAVRSFFRF